MKEKYYHTKDSVDEYIKLAKGVDSSELIEKLKPFLRKNSTVLELGTGPGTDWSILQKDYQVTGSDNSLEFLKRLEENFREGHFLLLDASALQTNQKFNAIYSNKVLHHLTDEELKQSIQKQIDTLNKGGIISHSFWNGTGEEIFKGMYVNYHTAEEIEPLFAHYFDILLLDSYKEFEDNDSLHLIARKK